MQGIIGMRYFLLITDLLKKEKMKLILYEIWEEIYCKPWNFRTRFILDNSGQIENLNNAKYFYSKHGI
jgi:hypothetical protein